MAAPARTPQRVIIEYGDTQSPKKVGVREHIRRGMKKLSGKDRKAKKARAEPNEVSPELKSMAADSATMASILERME